MSTVINNPNIPKERNFLAYIAGVEVPAESATVSFGTFRFPEINLTVPPHRLLHRIGADDRLPIALFYQDHWAYSKPEYCLLAEGEVTGWSYNRSGRSASFSLSAIDPMAVLTSLFLFYITDVDVALGNNATKRRLDDGASDVNVGSLPINFFYKFLQNSGTAVKRPVDILLNIIGSVNGFVSGFPVYSKAQELYDAVSKAKSAARATKHVKGADIHREALSFVDKANASFQPEKEGPTAFSSSGLVRFVSKKLGVPMEGLTPRDIYDYCKSKNTVSTAHLASGATGALLFESDTNDLRNITAVSIVGPGSTAISVILNDQVSKGSEGFRKVHARVAKNESLNNPGYVVLDQFGKTGKPAGIAVGMLQHNQRVGTLFDICQAMLKKNKSRFEEIMQGEVPINMFFNEAIFRAYPFHDNSSYWFPRFSKAFSDDEFVAVQYAFDKSRYFDVAYAIATEAGMASEKYVALIMDTVVQTGEKNARRLMARAKALAGNTATRAEIAAKFAFITDRFAIPAGRSWNRREKILRESGLSEDVYLSGKLADEKTYAGIRSTGISQDWRKVVGYAFIPGVDYGDALKGLGNQNATTPLLLEKGEQAKARIQHLEEYKKETIKKLLKELFPGSWSYVQEQIEQANREFTKRNPEHEARVSAAKRAAQTVKVQQRNVTRAKIAVQFFMRWMAKSKIRDHIVAFPDLENPDSDGIFPVLAAMKNENVAQALVQYSQASSGRSGSLWDFVKNIFQITLWELGFMVAPAALKTDEEHKIIGRMNSTTVTGGKPVLSSYVSKPNMYFGLPPSCNTWFPSMYDNFQMGENYATQPTRTYLDDSTMANILNMQQRQDFFTYAATAKAAYPPECDAALHNPPQKNKNNKDVVVFPEELYKGPVTNRHQTPTWFYFLYRQSVAKRKKAMGNITPVSPAQTPDVKVKITGHSAQYTKGGVTYSVPYADDKREAFDKNIFIQQGYCEGKPIKFSAVNVEGHILHSEAAKAYLTFKAEAKKDGYTVVLRDAFRTMAEQVSKFNGEYGDKPGFSPYQYGAKLRFQISGGDTQQLQNLLYKYGSSVLKSDSLDFKELSVVVGPAKRAVLQTLKSNIELSGQNAKGNEKYVQTTMPAIVFDILHSKTAKRSTKQKDSEHEIYFKYAEFEHYREKFSSRTAAVSGVFNPYVVMGFPSIVYDNAGGLHVVGLPVQGTHSLSNRGGSSTSVQMTFVRTFHEMLELSYRSRDGLPIGPMDPIKQVSDLTQRIDNARSLYKKLFYGGEEFNGRDALGDYQNILGWAKHGAPPDRIVADPLKPGYNLIADINREVDILPEAMNLFADANNALHYCARPVCTIEEYIDFYQGVRRSAAHPAGSTMHNSSFDMPFYYQIRLFKEGVFRDPTEDGLTPKEMQERLAALPDFLRDWVGALLLYRQEIYVGPPQYGV